MRLTIRAEDLSLLIRVVRNEFECGRVAIMVFERRVARDTVYADSSLTVLADIPTNGGARKIDAAMATVADDVKAFGVIFRKGVGENVKRFHFDAQDKK